MSKYVNVSVSTTLSTDFFIEVPDDATKEQIEEIAKKEVVLPHTYPEVLDTFLKTRMGIRIQGIDSMLKSWDVDDLAFIVDENN